MLTLRDLKKLPCMLPYSRDMEVAAIVTRNLLQEIQENNLRCETLEALQRHLASLPPEARRIITRTHTKVTIENSTERIEER